MRIKPFISLSKKTPLFRRSLSEISEIEAGEVLKSKEFTGVIDCFQCKPNEEIGVFWRTQIIIILMLFWIPVFAQSEWADQASEKLGTFQKNYLYPSVLRALNGGQSNEFNNLIKDIRYVRVLRIDSSFIAENQSLISDAEISLEKEKFENIAVWQDEDGSTKTLYVKEKKDRILGFLAYDKGKDNLLIIEIVGDFNVKNLSDLMNIDFNQLNEFVGVEL